MNIELSLFSFIELLTFSAAFMLGILFFSKPSANRKANIFLGLLLWVISFEIGNSLLKITEINNLWKTFFETFIVFGFTPFLYLYTFQTVNKSYNKILLLLIFPAFLVNILVHFGSPSKAILFIFELLLYIFEITLLFFILKEIHFTKLNLKNYYSQVENKKINWIKALVFFSFLYLMVDFIQVFLSFETQNTVFIFDKVTTIFDFFLIYWIAYHGFTQSEIFKNPFLQEIEIEEKEYSVSTENQERFIKIEDQIASSKVYLNKELNLRSLSNHLDINEKELSMLINRCSKTNFYHFINKFRIAEFKRLSETAKAAQLSIFRLAQEAGFSSKSTFYNAFKTLEGKTPKQYQLSLK